MLHNALLDELFFGCTDVLVHFVSIVDNIHLIEKDLLLFCNRKQKKWMPVATVIKVKVDTYLKALCFIFHLSEFRSALNWETLVKYAKGRSQPHTT